MRLAPRAFRQTERCCVKDAGFGSVIEIEVVGSWESDEALKYFETAKLHLIYCTVLAFALALASLSNQDRVLIKQEQWHE